MIKVATILRPARLEGLYNTTMFIPPNSNHHLIEVDMGFKNNPIYKQEKLCYFLPENIYYQKLIIVDGKANAIKDDARTIVITGQTAASGPIHFNIEIYPHLPDKSAINKEVILLPFYPEINTEIIIRDNSTTNIFHHFSCAKVLQRANALSHLQLRYLGNYHHSNVATILRKWHPDVITLLHNIPNRQ